MIHTRAGTFSVLFRSLSAQSSCASQGHVSLVARQSSEYASEILLSFLFFSFLFFLPRLLTDSQRVTDRYMCSQPKDRSNSAGWLS
ncbi:hypothetical protein P175DRAFT_0297836 [Aspergillus ochraceoroseus IBT 24754]|uniref:Uncharacterized protein n=1 Tax=Aspergillus ochraceoroseus IBT 24754 TaxID=1392256 RepID=A0A2T5LSS1_9EURO|nr:uncharacterized protein P175DRAFT_0297836 [Aspergillus ochraceoroseus IBT 24754]PTU19316.1 hypothetical protein P175DRAFT_0297836 [Aspergillus ochraceoroseus IBT 24754]